MSGEGVPRYWPIVYILAKLKRLESYRRLQYLIYAAKREGLSTEYDFILSNGSLVSPQIKLDLEFLNAKGLLKMEFHKVWTFEITRRCSSYAQKLLKIVSRRQQGLIQKSLCEVKDFSYAMLMDKLISESLIRRKDLSCQSRNLDLDAKILTGSLKDYLPSHNLLLLTGSLDYIREAVRKIKLAKKVKRQILLIFSGYVKELGEIISLTRKNPGVFGSMDLSYIAEDFELLQEICQEAGILSPLQEKYDFTVFNEL